MEAKSRTQDQVSSFIWRRERHRAEKSQVFSKKKAVIVEEAGKGYTD